VDYDGDGTLDMISGCYDPGFVYLFRGLGKGKYEKIATILDKNGDPVTHHLGPEKGEGGKAAYNNPEKFGSWPALVDWDDDGDLDLLIGSFAGKVFLRANEGTRAKPLFAGTPVGLTSGKKTLAVNGHANPVAADWDGDGIWDLVVGASDGGVVWFRNAGTKKQPSFEEARALVEAKSKDKFLSVKADEKPRPGVRAQICVADYDLDGKLDLILGDFAEVQGRDRGKGSRQSFVWLYRRRSP